MAYSPALKPSIFITWNKFPSFALERLREKFTVKCWSENAVIPKEVLKENVKGVFAICCSASTRIDKDVVLAAGEHLKLICTYSVGVDHLEVDYIKSKNIKIGYGGNVGTEAAAEYGLALLLTVTRRIVEASCMVKGGFREVVPESLCCFTLENSIVGIVGCGRIGVSIARKVKGFNQKRLLYYSRTSKPDVAAMGGELVSIDELIKESDFIIVTIALTNETNGIISRERINSMKSNAIFINIARAGVVDQNALLDALQNKRIAGAGLDVTSPEPLDEDHPLLKLDNVVITPHIAVNTYSSRMGRFMLVVENVIATLENREMPSEFK